MPIMTDGPMLEPENKGIDQFHVGMGAALAATVSETLSDLPVAQLYRLNTTPTESTAVDNALPQSDPMGNPLGGPILADGPEISEATKPAVPRVDMIEAIDRVKKAGLAPHLKLPDQPDISPAQLDIMIERARARQERDTTIERGPQGFVPSALSVGTSFLVGAIDPINVASAFIPVVGEMRYGKMLASAGDGLANRMAVRASVGAAEGAVGQAALEPLDWWSHTQDGRDFGMADVLQNVMFGAVLGGGLHAGAGSIGDRLRTRAGKPLYPFAPGDVLGSVQGTHLPATMMDEDGISADALEAHFNGGNAFDTSVPHDPAAHTPIFPEDPDARVTPAMLSGEVTATRPMEPSATIMTIDDLPQRAKEDAARAGIASLIDGEPLRVGEMLETASQTDPRIAESFDAWHGSPHDFDRFDISQIGTGEGAQKYGPGLYFAEQQVVAKMYSTTASAHATGAEALATDQVRAAGGDHAKAEATLREYSERNEDPDRSRIQLAAADLLRDGLQVPDPQLYKVRVNADHRRFLDWDKPFNEQSPEVLQALKKLRMLIANNPDKSGITPQSAFLLDHLSSLDARDFRKQLEYDFDPITASELFSEAGIPGIKYLDQRSRDTGDGSRNFVVFDDKHIEITHKNGEPVTREQFLEERKAAREQDEADAVAAKTTAVEAKTPRGRAAADPKTWSLNEFLAHEGGLKPDEELTTVFGSANGPFVPGFGALVRPNGRTLDDAVRLAKDHGYMFDAGDVTGAEARLTPRDLLDLLSEEGAGRKQYRLDHEAVTKVDTAREADEIIRNLHDEIEATTGVKGTKVDPALEDRVVQMVTREGERDVLAAYERAIMEDAERYEGLANERQNTTGRIAGWDADDAGAAPRDGVQGSGAGREAGLPVEGPRRADGGQPRSDGRGDRTPVANALDRDAAWRSLSRATPEFDEPAIIAASKAADEVKAPPSKLDERVSASEKADAYAKQMYDMFAHRLPEEDRQRLDDVIKAIADNNEAREIAIVRGGSCLFGVV